MYGGHIKGDKRDWYAERDKHRTHYAPDDNDKLPGQERVAKTIRPGVYQIWDCWYEWRWHIAVTDDFGRLIVVNANKTNHSLLT